MIAPASVLLQKLDELVHLSTVQHLAIKTLNKYCYCDCIMAQGEHTQQGAFHSMVIYK